MNEIEQQIWSAAFGAYFVGGYHPTGWSCSDKADRAVVAYREELARKAIFASAIAGTES